jgi:hypothetical protein
MILDNAKIGDKAYGIIPQYGGLLLKGVKIKQFEVVKINKKTVGIAFDVDSRKTPQLLPKYKECEGINENPIKLLKDYVVFAKNTKWKDYLKTPIIKYCKRKIKQYEEEKQ